MNQQPRRASRGVAGGLVAAALLAATVGCTAGGQPEKTGGTPLPSRSVGQQPTLEAKPVPMEVTVAKVFGDQLRREQRKQLQKQVARLLSGYFDDAFLAGDYPRSDFSGALAAFSPGAARRAGADRALLTNAEIGTTTQAVVARAKKARLDVLAPGRRVVGLTARVRLVFLQQPDDGVDKRVTVSGRLLVNRKKSGSWQIFGYDLTRSSEPATKGASR